MAEEKWINESELTAISKALGDTFFGLSGSRIAFVLEAVGIEDIASDETKWKRIYCALAERQNQSQNRRAILEFIRRAMRPEYFLEDHSKYEALRAKLNQALSFIGLAVLENGQLVAAEKAQTISDAKRRADELRADLTKRGVHPDVLRFCKAELVADNYFHAVLEASKSVAEKLRVKANVTGDGAALVDQTLLGDIPKIKINRFISESEKSEQKGFANLVKGVFAMFRNPTAHEPRILWKVTKEDAEDLLSLLSLMHRRLDVAK